jgi:hypothetical protein
LLESRSIFWSSCAISAQLCMFASSLISGIPAHFTAEMAIIIGISGFCEPSLEYYLPCILLLGDRINRLVWCSAVRDAGGGITYRSRCKWQINVVFDAPSGRWWYPSLMVEYQAPIPVLSMVRCGNSSVPAALSLHATHEEHTSRWDFRHLLYDISLSSVRGWCFWKKSSW